jgi:hypothetical protein
MKQRMATQVIGGPLGERLSPRAVAAFVSAA